MTKFLRLVARPVRSPLNRLLGLLWRLRVSYGPNVALDRPERLTVVLLSYLRPENIEPIARAALKCDFVRKVVVQNNNPAIDMRDWIELESDRLHVSNSPIKQGAGSRWFVALRENGEHFLAIDDDVFLFPHQIKALFLHLLADPSVPHGVHGTCDVSDGSSGPLHHLARSEAKVDVLHQLYLVTGSHVHRYHQLLDELQRSAPRAWEIADTFGDDIVISHVGDGMPRIHDVGWIPVCPSSHRKGVALNALDEFHADRLSLYRVIRQEGMRTEPNRRKAEGAR